MTEARRELRQLPIATIEVVPNFNPRRHFKAKPLEDLIENIRADGVIQPILVRQRDDGSLALIAGERRLRASTAIGLESIPSYIVECDDATALRLALAENAQREDISVAEEAIAARDYLDLCDGDVGLAARSLGWSEPKLRARLLLLQAAPEVLDAVGEGTLSIGHAELLSGLPHANQQSALPQIIELKMGIAQLKDMLRGFVIPLATAIFPLDGCAGCPHNTQTQGDFFSQSVEGANCQKRECFKAKTDAVIEARRTTLLEEVATVALDSEKAPDTYTLLVKEGVGGVGSEQFDACRGCSRFGALIRDRLDARCGRVERPVCFDLSCNRVHVEAHAKTLEASNEAIDTSPALPASGRKGKPGSKASKAKNKAKQAKKPTVAATPSAVREHVKAVYREAASRHVEADNRIILALAAFGIQALAPGGALDELLGKEARKASSAEKIARLSMRDQADIASFVKEAACRFLQLQPDYTHQTRTLPSGLETAIRIGQSHALDLTKCFSMSEAYLSACTVSGIEAVLDESGFSKWLRATDGGEKALKKLLGMAKKDLPGAVMATGFDWTGYVPSIIRDAKPEAFTT